MARLLQSARSGLLKLPLHDFQNQEIYLTKGSTGAQMVALFLCIFFFALLLLIFGRSVIPKPAFAVLLVLLVTAFAVIWTWAAYVIPPAATEKMRDLNYHPDVNVRALQKGEISIEEYVRRKADGTPPLRASTAPAPVSGQSDA